MAIDVASIFASKSGGGSGGGSPISGVAQLTPWGAGIAAAADIAKTGNNSNAAGGRTDFGGFSFGGIQTGGTQGGHALPWYAYAAAALAVVGFMYFKRR